MVLGRESLGPPEYACHRLRPDQVLLGSAADGPADSGPSLGSSHVDSRHLPFYALHRTLPPRVLSELARTNPRVWPAGPHGASGQGRTEVGRARSGEGVWTGGCWVPRRPRAISNGVLPRSVGHSIRHCLECLSRVHHNDSGLSEYVSASENSIVPGHEDVPPMRLMGVEVEPIAPPD